MVYEYRLKATDDPNISTRLFKSLVPLWWHNCDRIWENQSVSEKNIALLPFTPPSNFEANPTLCLQVRRASFSLFIASTCSNDYFHSCAIIDFLTNLLDFPNTVTINVQNHTSLEDDILLCPLGQPSFPGFLCCFIKVGVSQAISQSRFYHFHLGDGTLHRSSSNLDC